MAANETPGLAPLVTEYDGNGNLMAKYHHDGGGLMAMTRNNSSYWYGFEAIGTARQLMDGQGQVSDAYAFDAWGNELTSPQSPIPNPFRYIGKHGYYWDTQSSLMLLGVRYYQAGLGRFMTIDPLKITNNWYVYTSNRPTMLIDPNGKIAIIPILCASACACVALCGIAVIGGCIAGCHDAGNLTWGCVWTCIEEVIKEMPEFQKKFCEACLIGCGLCLVCKFFKKCGPSNPREPDPPKPPKCPSPMVDCDQWEKACNAFCMGWCRSGKLEEACYDCCRFHAIMCRSFPDNFTVSEEYCMEEKCMKKIQ